MIKHCLGTHKLTRNGSKEFSYITFLIQNKHKSLPVQLTRADIKQLLDEVEHDIMNYQNRGLCYLPQASASADSTDTR